MRTFWISLLATTLFPCVVSARVVEFSAGAKATVGANLWSQPDATPAIDIGFTKARGGLGAGGGVWAEARFVRYLALETDLLFEWDTIWEHQDWWWGRTTTKAKAWNFRLPVLVKGVLPLGATRLSLGIGPEFVFPLSSSAEFVLPTQVITNAGFKVRTRASTMLTMELGVTFELGYGIVLPVQIRAAYNASQPSSWGERVKLYRNGQEVTLPQAFDTFSLLYQNSWDFRLLLGVGYDF